MPADVVGVVVVVLRMLFGSDPVAPAPVIGELSVSAGSGLNWTLVAALLVSPCAPFGLADATLVIGPEVDTAVSAPLRCCPSGLSTLDQPR